MNEIISLTNLSNLFQDDSRFTPIEKDLLFGCLHPNPKLRIKINDLVKHPYFDYAVIPGCVNCLANTAAISEKSKVLNIPSFLPISTLSYTLEDKIMLIRWMENYMNNLGYENNNYVYLMSQIFDEYCYILGGNPSIPELKKYMLACFNFCYMFESAMFEFFLFDDITIDEIVETCNDIIRKLDSSIYRSFPALYFAQNDENRNNAKLFDDLYIFALGINKFSIEDTIAWLEQKHGLAKTFNINPIIRDQITDYYNEINTISIKYK